MRSRMKFQLLPHFIGLPDRFSEWEEGWSGHKTNAKPSQLESSMYHQGEPVEAPHYELALHFCLYYIILCYVCRFKTMHNVVYFTALL